MTPIESDSRRCVDSASRNSHRQVMHLGHVRRPCLRLAHPSRPIPSPVAIDRDQAAWDRRRRHGSRHIMSLSTETVVAASNALVLGPRQRHDRGDRGVPARPLPRLLRAPARAPPVQPGGGVGASPEAVDAVLARARRFGLPDLHWWVRLDSPPEVADVLEARGAEGNGDAGRARGRSEPRPPRATAADPRGHASLGDRRLDAQGRPHVAVTVFGGSLPPEERLSGRPSATAPALRRATAARSSPTPTGRRSARAACHGRRRRAGRAARSPGGGPAPPGGLPGPPVLVLGALPDVRPQRRDAGRQRVGGRGTSSGLKASSPA